MPKITPFLWFDGDAEEAAKFYVSLFKKSKILKISRAGNGGSGKKAAAMSVSFKLEGQEFIALNGGPHYKFTPAISLFVSCKTQKEVDTLWRKLCKGGTPSRCGWLQDKYGLSWQIIPTILGELLQSKDADKAARAHGAMMDMVKLDIKGLKKAAEAGPKKAKK